MVTPDTAIEVVDENPDEVCIGFICPVGKNMFVLVDANPTVGIGGSGKRVGGAAEFMFGIAIDAEVDTVDAGAADPDAIDADAAIAIGLLLPIVETCGGAYPCWGIDGDG